MNILSLLSCESGMSSTRWGLIQNISEEFKSNRSWFPSGCPNREIWWHKTINQISRFEDNTKCLKTDYRINNLKLQHQKIIGQKRRASKCEKRVTRGRSRRWGTAVTPRPSIDWRRSGEKRGSATAESSNGQRQMERVRRSVANGAAAAMQEAAISRDSLGKGFAVFRFVSKS